MAEKVKQQLRVIYQAEQRKAAAEAERKKHEAEAEKAKAEMWKMENERIKLEKESELEKIKIQEAEDIARRQNNEIERQKLIAIYGDPDAILKLNTTEPTQLETTPSAPPAYDFQLSDSPTNNNRPTGPVIPPRNNKPGKKRDESSQMTHYYTIYNMKHSEFN